MKTFVKKSLPALLMLIAIQLSALPVSEDQEPVILMLGNSIVSETNWDFDGFKTEKTSVIDFTTKQMTWILDWGVFSREPGSCIVIGGQEDFLLEVSPDNILMNFREIASSLIAHHIEPVLTSVIYMQQGARENAEITKFNTLLEVYCQENTIHYIDLNEALGITESTGNYMCGKGRYLGEDGRERINNIIGSWLTEHYNTTDNSFRKVGPRDKSGASIKNAAPAEANCASIDLHYLSRERIARIIGNSPDKVKITMLGNSITQGGGDWNNRLKAEGIRNCGQGGYTTGQMLWHMDTTVIAAQPELCFVMGGINDLSVGVAKEKVVENIKEIIRRLRNAGITPVVQSTFYQRNNPSTYSDIRFINRQLKRTCRKHDLDYLNINKDLSNRKGLVEQYTTDGTHLTEEGYKIWCRELNNFLRNHPVYH